MVRSQVRYLSDLKPLANIPASTPVVADAVTYIDFSGTFKFNDHVEMFGGIDNAFDEQPPLLTSSWGGDVNTDVMLYDVMGRRYFVGLRTRF